MFVVGLASVLTSRIVNLIVSTGAMYLDVSGVVVVVVVVVVIVLA